ncbi:YjbF family lipoprotein [Vibrio albus]|uniref:YjbF family lipoprotein n=1 Tax=Vibrio albus TaxID=2200953 RepID=A0A2U3BCT1_9VIBR|nr:YjbF family lipoprotein [Vibrio albus]PWI34564.1 YjbF family lipoprotein [Vibrio albus]
MNKYNYLIIALCSTILLGCTQKFQATNATFKEALFGFDDVNKASTDISALPWASTYVTIGEDGSQIFMVLAFPEPAPHDSYQTQLKWVSSDRAMIVTENGRMVKTVGLLENNLAGAIPDNKFRDPLSLLGKKPGDYRWEATFDWQPNYRYGYHAKLHWQFIADEVIQSDAWKKDVLHYQETVSFPALDSRYINHFWLDKQTHQVVKSIQHLGPNMPAITMTILKPFAG